MLWTWRRSIPTVPRATQITRHLDSDINTFRTSKVSWKSVPTQTITAGGVDFAFRELGIENPGPPVVFLTHLAAVLDNWDPRVVDGFAEKHRVITFDSRGIGASSGTP